MPLSIMNKSLFIGGIRIDNNMIVRMNEERKVRARKKNHLVLNCTNICSHGMSKHRVLCIENSQAVWVLSHHLEVLS